LPAQLAVGDAALAALGTQPVDRGAIGPWSRRMLVDGAAADVQATVG